MKSVLIVVVVVGVVIVAAFTWLGFSSRGNAPALGLKDNKLTPCPASPNCISSDAADPEHNFPAITLAATARWEDVLKVVSQMDLSVTETDQDYLRAEAKSSLFGFVDDLELHKRNQSLAIRSSSRVGYSDMGANRKRAEQIQGLLAAAGLTG